MRYKVEHLQMGDLENYLNRASKAGYEVVSVSAGGFLNEATLILREVEKQTDREPETDRKAYLAEWIRRLPEDVDGSGHAVDLHYLLRHLMADIDELMPKGEK